MSNMSVKELNKDVLAEVEAARQQNVLSIFNLEPTVKQPKTSTSSTSKST